jgi:tRNA A-37 threonylcarbamoyl transferase component Bud32
VAVCAPAGSIQSDGIQQTRMVMEPVEGEALPCPEPETALNVTGQIARELETAHETGIVHRDLKPAYISRPKTRVISDC